MDSAGPIDWSAALRGWTFADVLTAFESLPESLQQPLHAALTTAPKPVPPPAPWAVAGGSVSWLLDELGLSGLYGSTFAEYGVTVAQMLGPEGGDPSALIASLRELGVTRDHRDKILRLARSPRPCGASGGCFDRAFLAACRPLHAQHMGCENMGPLLYSLVRFTKARQVLEVGAGYTSVWILQALADNDAELAACAAAVATDGYTVAQADWMADAGAATEAAAAEAAAGGGACGGGGDGGDGASRFWVSAACERGASLLHAIDDMGAAEGGNRGSAHLIEAAAERLGLRRHLKLHQGDAYEMAGAPLSDGDGDAAEGDGSPAAAAADLDMLWLDFGLGGSTRIGAFLDAWWPRLRRGGFLLMHSTLTNAVTRAWLEAQRERRSEAASDVAATRCGHLCEFETLSLLEPHKRYQNSVSIFQKRDGGWAEPLHTMYP